jgi:hypothetical protein
MIRNFAIALLFLVGQKLKAQERPEILSILGIVKDSESKMPIKKAEVYVWVGESVASIILTENGKYNFELPLGIEYKICLSTPVYFQKIIVYDTRNDNSIGGWEWMMDIQLDKVIEGFHQKFWKCLLQNGHIIPKLRNIFSPRIPDREAGFIQSRDGTFATK